MGTHPIFESDFDCLTEMNSYEREIQNLLPVLNNLERNLLGRSFNEQTASDRPSYSQHAGPSGHYSTNLTANGISQLQNTYSTDEVKSIDERLSFLEEKLQHYRRGQEHDSISRRRNQTLPSQSLNTITQNRNRLNELTERLKNVDFDQNISLNEEVRISQDHFNRSVPAQLHFPIHSTSKNSRNKALNNRAEPIKIRNNIEPNPLEEIQSRLDSIKHNFELGRGDVLNQPGVSSYAHGSSAHDLMSELKRKEDELEKLRLEQERLNHIRNEIRKNDLARSKSLKNDNLEQAS